MRTTVPAPLIEPEIAARLLAAATEADAGLGTFTRLALMAGARRAELLDVRRPDVEWPIAPGETGNLMIACGDGLKAALSHRMGISIRGGLFPLFRSPSALRVADREAAVLLGRELNQAVTGAKHKGCPIFGKLL